METQITKQIERLKELSQEIAEVVNKEFANTSNKSLKEIEYEHPSGIVEMKDSIKVVKNTKGYNYEIRLVAKENVDLLSQLDYIKSELDKRIKLWNLNDEQ